MTASIAHRANGFGFFENTLAAFAAAKKAYIAGQILGIECDIRYTRDRIAVVYHDADTRRINVQNRQVIEQTRYCQLDSVIPMLKDVLMVLGKEMEIHLELKTINFPVYQLSKQIQGYRVCFSSFYPQALMQCQRVAPHIARALLVAPSMSLSTAEKMTKYLTVEALHLSIAQLTPAWLELCEKHHLLLRVYTANQPHQWYKIAALPVAALMTDRPKAYQHWLQTTKGS